MSQLDQAKKEAKRLFNLAKASQQKSQNAQLNYIEIENLSKSREIISLINGYKNWHEYEEVLKNKDLLFGKKDDKSTFKENNFIYENRKYYIQDISFNTLINPNSNNSILVVEKEHKPVILGKRKEKRLFETIEKKWILDQYPVLITGSSGTGKTENLFSIAHQHINNNEGVIYFDGKGENNLYSKFFSCAKQANRLNDLYLLNFSSTYSDNQKLISNSIDPINTMLGNNEYFNKFFGRLGVIIHSILKEIHHEDNLMDIESLESTLMLNNLIIWNKNKKFKTNEINNYLVEIGLSSENTEEEDFEEALLKHSHNAHTAYETIKIFKDYSHIFKTNCSLNIESIFLERKLLLILLPSLEKAPEFMLKLGELIISQVKNIEQKYQRYNIHFQNIILDDFPYYCDSLGDIDFNKNKNNYLFSSQAYIRNSNVFNYVLNNAKLNVIMRQLSPDLPNKIKFDLIENLKEFPKFKYKDTFLQAFYRELRDLNIGEAYVLCKNQTKKSEEFINKDYEYYCTFINFEYLTQRYEKMIWVVDHPTPLLYIKGK